MMLGPLVYLLILLAIILAGGLALDFLVQEPGRLVIHYNDRIHELSLLEAAILLALLIVAVLIVLWVLRFIIAIIRFIAGDETAFNRFFSRARERRGFDALARALIAMASGDAKRAKRKAQQAERRLMRPELTRVVNAQAAEMAGDDIRARTYYRAMLTEPETAFAGTRGLLRLALKEGDTERALKLAEHANSLNPKDGETLETLYALQSQTFDWAAARKTLSAQSRYRHLSGPEAHRRDAALALAQSEDAAGLGEEEHARALAVEAARIDPTNAAAVSAAVRHLVAAGSKRAASKLVTDAWRARPQPQLGAAYAAIEPDEAPAARRRRFETLFALHPEHPETRFLRAELALADHDWTGAHAAIESLRETEPSARSCVIMAAIARGRGEPEHVVRGWLARAVSAPRDEAMETTISHAAMLPLLVEIEGSGMRPSPDTAAIPGADVPPPRAEMASPTEADAAAREEPPIAGADDPGEGERESDAETSHEARPTQPAA